MSMSRYLVVIVIIDGIDSECHTVPVCVMLGNFFSRLGSGRGYM